MVVEDAIQEDRGAAGALVTEIWERGAVDPPLCRCLDALQEEPGVAGACHPLEDPVEVARDPGDFRGDEGVDVPAPLGDVALRHAPYRGGGRRPTPWPLDPARTIASRRGDICSTRGSERL